MFAVVAETRDAARRAATLAKVEYRDLPHVTDVAAAVDGGLSVRDRAAEARARRGGAGDGGGAASAEGADAGRGAGPLLSRGDDRLRRAGRGRRGDGLFLDAAPERGAAHGGARARRAVERGDDHRAAHGRRLRRQGDAAEPLRRGGGGGGEEVGAGGEDPARPRRRHGGDRQAARFPQRLRGRVRRRRADPGGGRDVRGALRVLGGPERAGDGPGAVPCRQRVLLSGGKAGLQADENEHGLQYRVPRVRRAAGADHRRADHGGDRLRAGQGPAGGAAGELLRRGRAQRHALSPDGDGQRHRAGGGRAGRLVGLCGAAAGGAATGTPGAA